MLNTIKMLLLCILAVLAPFFTVVKAATDLVPMFFLYYTILIVLGVETILKEGR